MSLATCAVLMHAWAGAIKSYTMATLSCISSSAFCSTDSPWHQHDEHGSSHCSRLSQWSSRRQVSTCCFLCYHDSSMIQPDIRRGWRPLVCISMGLLHLQGDAARGACCWAVCILHCCRPLVPADREGGLDREQSAQCMYQEAGSFSSSSMGGAPSQAAECPGLHIAPEH